MNAEHPSLLSQLKQLRAENASLRATLNELQNYTASKEKEIQQLKLQTIGRAETESQLDNQALEVSILQDVIDSMEQKAVGTANREAGLEQQIRSDISEHHQMQDLLQQYAALQLQLEELQGQLHTAEERNFLLHNQTSLMAGQESSLANMQHERDEWKAIALLKADK